MFIFIINWKTLVEAFDILIATYFKDKKKKIELKYYKSKRRFESKSGLISQKVTLKLYRKINAIKFISSKLKQSIKKLNDLLKAK